MKSAPKLRLWRAMSALLTALVLAGGITVAASGSASASPRVNMITASPSCYGFSCHGHDPFVYNCGKWTRKNVSAYYQGVAVANLTNWYGYCNANWAEGTLTAAGLNAGDSIIIDISTTDSRNNFEYMCYPGPDNTGALWEACYGTYYGGPYTAWTDMVDGTNQALAQVYVNNRNGAQIAMAQVWQ